MGGKEIFAADIGGTSSRFAHFRVEEKGLALVASKWLKTKESGSFRELLEHLKKDGFSLLPEKAAIAVIAVAGPVVHGSYSAPPYINWDIDVSSSLNDFGIAKCLLINDFIAQAYACLTEPAKIADQVLPGVKANNATIAVIGAGTGLGKAALVPDGKGGYIAIPSEGGHTDFPFVSKREFEYLEFLKKKVDDEYIIGNVVLSGRGLVYLHEFLTGETLMPEEVAERITEDSETTLWAARFYGRACRNFVLETLSLGGLYIAGGVAAKNPAIVMHRAFMEEFRNSPTLSEILEKIPVYLIKDEESGLWGAAYKGLLEIS